MILWRNGKELNVEHESAEISKIVLRNLSICYANNLNDVMLLIYFKHEIGVTS